MKKFLGIVVLGLFFCNFGIFSANADELYGDCIRKGTTEFNDKVKQHVKKNSVTVMYFACTSSSNWTWRYERGQDFDAIRQLAYKRCLKEASKYKIKTCHLFSINDKLVYGKDPAFVAKVEKEAKAKLTTKVAKKQTKPEDAKKLNKYCIKKGKKVFNEKAKPWAKKKEFALVMYFHCKGKDDWHFYLGYENDYDKANETAYNICASKNNIACHLFSIGDKIVYGKDATFVAKAKEKVEKRLAKISETRKKSGSGFYVYKVALSENDQEDFFTKKSPTTFIKITFKEEKSIGGIRKVEKLADVGKNKKKTFKSFTFAAEYEDNITVEIFIEYHKGAKNFERAEFLASYYANMFGQMPHFLKLYTNKIYIHKDIGKDDGVWYAVPNKREFHINRSRCAKDSSFVYSRCAVVMMHELAHILQQMTGIISPSKWNKARKLDKNYCSEYAKTNSWEDFAESVMCWVAVRHKPDKLKKDDVKKIKEYLANRFKFFDEMNWNIYPL